MFTSVLQFGWAAKFFAIKSKNLLFIKLVILFAKVNPKIVRKTTRIKLYCDLFYFN